MRLDVSARDRPMGVIARAFATGRGRFGALLVAAVLVLAFVGPLLAPHPPNGFVGSAFEAPNADAWLGTDTLGRDVLTRALAGGWGLLLIAGAGTILGVAVGSVVGIVAAYVGRRTDAVLMRAMDVLLAFPQLVLVLLLVSILGAPPWLVSLAVALAHLPQVARVIRAATLDVAQREFVRAAELNGRTRWQVITGEIVPNITSTLMVEAGLRLTFSIIVISGLNFLGFGAPPPDPAWGTMINENRIGLTSNPWAVVAPVTLIAILTVGMNMFTDAIAQSSLRVQPRRRHRRRAPMQVTES